MAGSSEQLGESGRLVDLDERLWLRRHHQGDPEAFGLLVRAYRAPVYGYLVRCGVASATRDDLFQDIFLKIHHAAESYQPSRPLKPWLFTIVANTVRNHFRGMRLTELAFADGAEAQVPDERPGSEREHEARATLSWLEQALTELPLAHREVLVLTCIEGMEQKAVSTALQIPVNTVKTHLRRARLTLARKRAERDRREQV